MKKIILIITLLLTFTKVYAYENEYFSIDMNESFKQQETKDRIYIFSKGNEYVSITIDNNKDKYDVSKFTEEDIKKQKEYLETKYKETFKDYTNNIQVTNMELVKSNTKDYLEYDFYFETKSSIGYNIYQRCRMYTTDNYVYSIVHNSDKEITNNDYLNTFKIKDSYLRKINIWVYAIMLIIILAIIILIDYLLHKKRH